MPRRGLDMLDMKLLQALELDGRASFSRIAEVLGVSDQTVARRYRRLRATAGLRVTGMTDESRLGQDSWIVRLGCTPNVAGRLASALARRPDTSYVDLLSGGTEVMCAMLPRTAHERDDLLLDELRRDGRATLAELQAATGQTEAVVRRRLDRLLSTGVLYFAVEYDREPLGHGVEAMCWLTVAPHALAGTGRAVAAHPEVRFAAAVTGQANLVLSVLCRTTADLYAYLSEKIGALNGVRTAETTLTLRRVKTLTYEPPPPGRSS